MFVSLNKKFIYTIITFFIFTAIIFLYSFYQTYGLRFQKELKQNITRNQQYVDLLYENRIIRRELQNLLKNNPGIKISHNISEKINNTKDDNAIEKTISNEKKRINQLQKNYEDRYASIYEGIKIIGNSSILIILALALFMILIRRWVIFPLKILSEVSHKVAQGDVTQRAFAKKKSYFFDETDILTDAFNKMLNKIENSIKEIKETENFLQNIIDGIPDGLRVIDADYNVIIANKEYYRQVGTDKKRLKCYEATQHRQVPCNQNIHSCPLREIIENKQKHTHVVQQFSHNPSKHLYINAAPLKIEKQNYIIEIIRDLSNDIEFSHQQKLSSLGFMTTSIAHEMKNNLGAIRIILECLLDKYYQEKPDDDNPKKLLLQILKQIVESIKVPERLLKLSQVSNNDKQEINCYDCITDVASLTDYEAKNRGIEIIIDKTKDITIQGNEVDFKMALINLIQNAIKAGKKGGQIKITLTEDKKHNIITIEDNGCGISKKALPHIFEPFYSEGKENKLGGTGLGLAIAKSIIEKQNGQIKVKSKINMGTCFSLQFSKETKK